MMIVYVEPIEGQGFRALVESPIPLVAEGPTRDEAVGRLKALMQDRLDSEDIFWPPGDQEDKVRILRQFAGDMKGDPIFAEYREAVAEYRRAVDAGDALEGRAREEAIKNLDPRPAGSPRSLGANPEDECEIEGDPLARFDGDLKDNPIYQDWVGSMAEYRRSVETDPTGA